MTDAEALSEPIVHAFEVWVKAFLGWLRRSPETPLLMVLHELRDGLRPIVRQLVRAAGRSVGQYQPAPSCPCCGERMHSKGFQERSVCCELGAVPVPVRRWRCPSCGTMCQPWWESAELVGSWTKSLWEVAMGLAVGLTYRTAERLMGQLGCPVSDTALQGWVTTHGSELAASEAATARAWEALEETPEAALHPERLYCEVDGYKVRVRGDGWREARVGVLQEQAELPADVRGNPSPVRFKRYVSTVRQEPGDATQAESFMRRVGLELERSGARYAREVVGLSDGASWIWERLPGQVPYGTKLVEILDFYHAAENLARAPRARYGTDEEAFERCFRELRELLKLGQVGRVLARLADLKEGTDPAATAEIERVEAYVREHRHRMSYARLKLDGYFIGSGAVESGCKLMLARVRGAGMRWRENRLEALLALRSQFLSDDWPEEVKRKAA